MLTQVLVCLGDSALTVRAGAGRRGICGLGLKRQTVPAIGRKYFRGRHLLGFKPHVMAAVGMVFIPGDKKVLAAPAVRRTFSHDRDLSKIRGMPSRPPSPQTPRQ